MYKFAHVNHMCKFILLYSLTTMTTATPKNIGPTNFLLMTIVVVLVVVVVVEIPVAGDGPLWMASRRPKITIRIC